MTVPIFLYQQLLDLDEESSSEDEETKTADVVPYNPNKRINLNQTQGFQDIYRFTKQQFDTLLPLLKLPREITTKQRYVTTSSEALAIVCFRLSYPVRYKTMCEFFGRSRAALCEIYTTTLTLLLERLSYLLEWREDIFTLETMQRYAKKIADKKCPLPRCFGFIDGTVRLICRPQKDQEILYSGHKHSHGIKFQSVITPDGIIQCLYGPVPGSRTDAYLLSESGLIDRMRTHMSSLNISPYYLFGDKGYSMFDVLHLPYIGDQNTLTPTQRRFNYTMSSLRQCVEWGFGHVQTNWAFTDWKKSCKLGLNQVGTQYKMAIIFGNLLSCLRGHNQTSLFYSCEPPSIEEYLRDVPDL